MNLVTLFIYLLVCIIFLITLVAIIYTISIYKSIYIQISTINKILINIQEGLIKKFYLTLDLLQIVKRYTKIESSISEQINIFKINVNDHEYVKKNISSTYNQITEILNKLFLVIQNHSKLKKHKTLLQTKRNLDEIDDLIKKSVMHYNTAVKNLNGKIVIFPNNIVSIVFNLQPKEFIDI
ncbi:MAG: LemA family protein [Candidatus Dojkabacteria bacterium]|nr:LemA family protein [Candidatus Dojkabacteria bacterium]